MPYLNSCNSSNSFLLTFREHLWQPRRTPWVKATRAAVPGSRLLIKLSGRGFAVWLKIVALKSVRAKAAPLQALGLFYIGNLFSNLFQFGFRVHNQLRDFGVVGFGAQGIEFAADFLAEKFQRSSDGVFGFGDT
jgi:hypothetical protein